MRVRVGVLRAATAAVGLGVALAACGGTPEPKALETQTEKPTATAKPTPTKSPSAKTTAPDDVVETGEAGAVDPKTGAAAERFVRDFLTAQNKATGNGDFSTVDRMVADTCDVCAKSKQYITKAYSGGGKVDGGIYTRPTVDAGSSSRDDRVVVTVEAVISAYKTTDGSGNVVDEGPAEKQRYQYAVGKVGGHWQVLEGSVVS